MPEQTGGTLVPELVVPRLRGSFGRPYYYAAEAPSTQRMPPPEAPHGAVALAEHQTEGRGRLGRIWIDEPGAGLALSVVLRPPPPVASWPELTLVAARAVADAIGEGAEIKQPNDVLVERDRAAGELRLRVVLARVDDEAVEPGSELRLAAELAHADDELR